MKKQKNVDSAKVAAPTDVAKAKKVEKPKAPEKQPLAPKKTPGKTRVVHILSDTNVGGAGKYLITYLKNYDRERYDCIVILPQNSKLSAEAAACGVQIIEAEGIADKSFSRHGVMSLCKILFKLKPDIIHTHSTLSGRIAGKIATTAKMVYTRHSVFPPDEYLTRGWGYKLNKWLNKYAADGIIAVCEAAKQNLILTGVEPEQIKVIYNGVEPLEVKGNDDKLDFCTKYGLNPEVPIAAIAARLTLVKGQRYIVEAAKMLKSNDVPIQVVIAGTGDEEKNLKLWAKNLGVLNKNVFFVGFLDDVTLLMNAMDIQLNASFGTEAASLALMEGMSLGKPAVVSNFGGNPEIITNGINGYVVPQKDSHSMAAAMEKLLKDDKGLKNNCINTYKKRFTAKKMVTEMEKYYENIMQK
ncbi:MAG: glycosyltransferase [Clostridiales bacterium]|nr:glycosyltransferase [Clostridiales bacterium]